MRLVITTINAVLLGSGLVCTAAWADRLTVPMNAISDQGVGASIGSVTFEDGKNSMTVRTELKGLPPGEHGFHAHEKPDCGPGEKDGKTQAGLAAGGHYDPNKTGKHEGPKGQGHLGDMPPLKADAQGNARQTLTVPRLKVSEVKGRSLMIHEGGDNYSDQPKPLGGGGARIACGVAS